ncbi:MAG TPA: type II secretion system minor pseudopilin GspJ [Gammaproteobacteria bacterium]|jgi:general secretion pathway protein J|nr:type II secretion system minor pseudopilin GspJ [Gammaproteobacteria bacterium]
MRSRGFTLIELLVALSITAILMVIAYGGLGALSKQADHSRDSLKRLRQVQLAMDIMSRDFEQLEPRPVRDGLGGTVPALLAGPDNIPPIQFTRGGWTNPLGTVRSTEERVAYSLEDGKLMRSWWPELDGQAQIVPSKEPLLDQVSSIKIQYMDPVSRSFQDVWPENQTTTGAPPPSTGINPSHNPPGANGSANSVDSALPVAVSIVITLKDLGDITRIVEVAGCGSAC